MTSPAPRGAAALFFIQMFSTLGFAVLYSTLVLYATHHLHFSNQNAAAVMGVFGAFNYGLHLFGGWLGGRWLSNRNLFVGGMALQVLGCAAIATGSLAGLYWGLAMFLTGSGLNVTCLNMMLTQRYAATDPRREAAFLWNYAGMNVGFFIGFTAAGWYQLDERYGALFIFATLGNLAAIVLAAWHWRTLADLDTPLLATDRATWRRRFLLGSLVLLGLVPLVALMLQHPGPTEALLKAVCAAVALALGWLTWRHPNAAERRRMLAYLLLALGSLVFWSLYQMAPNGLQTYAEHNVDRMVAGFEISPQWIQNINTAAIVLGGPLMAWGFARLRTRGWRIDVPQQFAASLLLMGAGFLALPLGIHLAGADGRAAFVWIFVSYLLQSLGELLISPVGYAMIGRLAPRQHQGLMMGAWMLVTGLASLFAGDFSGLLPEPAGSTPLATNPAYAALFERLGWGSVATGAALIALTPLLRRLIGPADRPEEDAPAAAVPH